MTEFLTLAWPPLLAAVALAVILRERFLDIREARRYAAVARHPSRRQRRQHPGRPVDGEPLTAEELEQYAAIMFRSAGGQGNQAPENSADEGA